MLRRDLSQVTRITADSEYHHSSMHQFLRYHAEKRQTNTQTVLKNPTHTTAVGMGNYIFTNQMANKELF